MSMSSVVASTNIALLSWLTQMIGESIRNISQLKDPSILRKVLSQIVDFPSQQSSTSSANKRFDNDSAWQNTYISMKALYNDILRYVRDTLNASIPITFDRTTGDSGSGTGSSFMNLLDMSQGTDQDGLSALLQLVFVVCLESNSKQHFAGRILNLSAECHQPLMRVLQQGKLRRVENSSKHIQIDKRDKQVQQAQYYRLKFEEMELLVQNSNSEIESLQNAIHQEAEQYKRLENKYNEISTQLLKLQQQLYKANQTIKAQQISDSHVTKQYHKQTVDGLQKGILNAEKEHQTQARSLKEEVRILNEEIDHLRTMYGGHSDQGGLNDHKNCVHIQQHKRIVAALNSKLKDAEQREWKDKLEIVKLSNTVQQLKLSQRRQNEKQSDVFKNVSISAGQAEALKVNVLKAIRDGLKKVVEAQK